MKEYEGIPADLVRCMVGVAETLGVEMSPERIAGYWSLFGHYGERPLVKAILQFITTPGVGPFFPSPSQLIEILEGAPAATEAEATATWVSVLTACRGGGGSIAAMCAADPRIRVGLIAAGGEYNVRTGADGEDERWRQRRFVQGFMGATELRRKSVAQPQLMRGIVAHLGLDGPTKAALLGDGKQDETRTDRRSCATEKGR